MKLPTLTLLAATLALSPLALHAQLAIPTHTADGGGGTSSGGTFTLHGTTGQPDAAPTLIGGNFTLTGGFWGGTTSSPGTTYANWAATNLPAGANLSFEGDANLDGISNGLVYVFGQDGAELFDRGILTAPPASLPADIDLALHVSADMTTWTPVLEITAGTITHLDPSLEIVDGQITHADLGSRNFYQYRVTLRD